MTTPRSFDLTQRLVYGLVLLGSAARLAAAGPPLDTALIEHQTGRKGALNKAGTVFKVSAPRAELKVSVDGWTMPPFMGLTSWAAFTDGKSSEAMVMGDLVLFQDEVNPVMSAALDHGLAVTALHNHFFFDEPKVYFMHIEGEGPLAQLAAGVGRALDTVKRIRDEHPQPAKSFGGPPLPSPNSITGGPIEELLGVKGQANDGMFKVVFGRQVRMDCGCDVGADMGVNTWAAFAGGDDDAVVDGDFAVHENELQAVLKALRKAGISIVAIHSHMTGETPRTLFLHYWGRGRTVDLAHGLQTALATQTK